MATSSSVLSGVFFFPLLSPEFLDTPCGVYDYVECAPLLALFDLVSAVVNRCWQFLLDMLQRVEVFLIKLYNWNSQNKGLSIEPAIDKCATVVDCCWTKISGLVCASGETRLQRMRIWIRNGICCSIRLIISIYCCPTTSVLIRVFWNIAILMFFGGVIRWWRGLTVWGNNSFHHHTPALIDRKADGLRNHQHKLVETYKWVL